MFSNILLKKTIKYRYSGINLKTGKEKTGKISALSETEAKTILLSNQIAVDQIEGVYSYGDKKEILDFFESLHLLIKSGMELVLAIETISGEKEKNFTRINDLLNHIKKGEKLSLAMNKTGFLTDSFISALIKTGEKTGNMEKALNSAIYYLKTMDNLKSKLISATIYPLITFIVSIITSVILLKYVVPVFIRLYKKYGDIELPFVTQILLDTSKFINSYFYYILFVFCILFAFFKYSKNSNIMSKLSYKFIKYTPGIKGVFENLKGFRLFQILYILTEAEVELIEALDILKNSSSNKDEKESLDFTIKSIKQGNSYSSIIKASKEYKDSVISIIISGEKSGNLKDAFNLLSKYFKKRFEKNLSTVTTIIEPLFLIFISIFVGFVLISLYLPMFNIVNVL